MDILFLLYFQTFFEWIRGVIDDRTKHLNTTSNPNPQSVALSQYLALSMIVVLTQTKLFEKNLSCKEEQTEIVLKLIVFLKKCYLFSCTNFEFFGTCNENLRQMLSLIKPCCR